MMIPVTALVFKDGDIDAGISDGLVRRATVINEEEIEQAFSAELKRDVPIIGEPNKVDATALMFRSGRTITIAESPDRLIEIISEEMMRPMVEASKKELL